MVHYICSKDTRAEEGTGFPSWGVHRHDRTVRRSSALGAGTCAGLSDGQLLARFLAGRDPSGELAFEVLVKRHGPMVERVCRQVLDDPCDVHDAWQAVFLVLARRAFAIRKRDSVAAWLHGVCASGRPQDKGRRRAAPFANSPHGGSGARPRNRTATDR